MIAIPEPEFAGVKGSAGCTTFSTVSFAPQVIDIYLLLAIPLGLLMIIIIILVYANPSSLSLLV